MQVPDRPLHPRSSVVRYLRDMGRGKQPGLLQRALLLAMLAACAVPASAATLGIRVDDGRTPLPDAVIELEAAGAPAIANARAQHVIDQKDETFVPYLTLLRRGDSIVFRNSDYTRHHVYTFSPVHPFEFVVPSGSTSESVTFDRTGVVAIGCNIHDRMIAYVFVTEAPWAAQSDSDGNTVFEDLPPGRYVLRAWHPRLRSGGRGEQREIDVPATGGAPVSVTLRVDAPPRPADRERSDY